MEIEMRINKHTWTKDNVSVEFLVAGHRIYIYYVDDDISEGELVARAKRSFAERLNKVLMG